MTSTGGSGSFSEQNIERTRLVVPKLHQSVWASNQPAIMGSSRILNRTGRTIQPVSQTDYAKSSTTTGSTDGFMPTIPQYSDEAIPVRRASVAKRESVEPVQQHVSYNVANTNANVNTVQQIRQPSVDQAGRRQLSASDRQAIMERAALIREQARRQAEAKAREDALAKMQAMVDAQNRARAQRQANMNDLTSIMMRSSDSDNSANDASAEPVVAGGQGRASVMPASNPFAPAAVNPMPTKANAMANASQLNTAGEASSLESDDLSIGGSELANVDQSGVMAVAQPNFLQRLMGAKVTISFKFNKQRILTVLRYVAVAVIVAASAYLAWDTYMTNQSVKSSFDGGGAASAMSISGTNPATADQTAISQEDMAAYTVPSDQPRYIRIPAINVNARVMSVGVNSRGNIDTPANLNDTAWYDGSAKPGQEGQVFIDGHTSFSSAIYAAFNDLPKLKEGDQITIERGDGQQINYHVTKIKTVNADSVDMGEALNPPEGAKRGLTLMTCTGTFNYRTQTADKRLIVYAVQD